MWTECPMKPADYQPSADDKKKADELRRNRLAQSRTDKAAYAHAKAAQGQGGSTSSETVGTSSVATGQAESRKGDKATGFVTLPEV